MDRRDQSRLIRVIGLLLVLGTLAVYGQTLFHGFVDFDDPDYVTKNSHVQAGLTFSGILWAFRTGHACNWHPLTWLSHMADCQLYGLSPGGPHFTNLIFHTANVLLLFVLLFRLTGGLWRSAIVAALFAWHPLHVESVAWISERKDVLSTFFWLLTTWAYWRYAKEDKLRIADCGLRIESKIQNLLLSGTFVFSAGSPKQAHARNTAVCPVVA